MSTKVLLNTDMKKSSIKSRENALIERQPATMPSAAAVAARRARVAQLERELGALRDADSSSDGEGGRLAGELDALRLPAAPRAAPRAAAALLPRLAAALPAHDAAFLHDYLLVLQTDDVARVETLTEELMQCIEGALAGGPGARGGGVVLGAWLAAAALWAWPRVPRAVAALHCLLEAFEPEQVEQLCAALQAALAARELLALSDAARGGRGGAEALGDRLRRAALAALLPAPGGAGGAEAGEAVEAALGGARWAALGAAQQLQALRAAARMRPALPDPPHTLTKEVKVAWKKVQKLCKPDE